MPENNMPVLTLEPEPTAPTLTLDTEEEEKVENPIADALANEPQLSPEEQKVVDDFAQKIDITNSSVIMQYGSAAQKKCPHSQTPLSRMSKPRIWEKSETRYLILSSS